jgi:predicted membrane channel-forming protein YqfA (hemolysin III family)
MPEPTPNPTTPAPPDWPAQAADAIVGAVEKVRDKTTKPVVTATRAAVFGIVAGVMGLIAVILLVLFLFRMTDAYLPGPVWAAYLLWGVVFIVAGSIMFARRTPRS